jgi:sugar lactone lactonase YvrE
VIYTVDPYTGDARCLTTDGQSWPPVEVSVPVCDWSAPEQPYLSEAQRATIVGHFTSLMTRVASRLPAAGNAALKQVAEVMNTDLAADRAQRVLPGTPTFGPDGSVWLATPWLEDETRLQSAVYRVSPAGTASLAVVVDAWVIKLLVLGEELVVSAITPEVTTIAWRVPANTEEVVLLSNP